MKWGNVWNGAKDLILISAILFLFFGGRVRLGIGQGGWKEQDQDSITYVDTVPFYYPVPRDSVVIRYVTARLPVKEAKQTKKEPETESAASVTEELVGDSADVLVPITQKVYGDSTYRAYVSGYHARLDSCFVYPKTTYIHVREPPKRWGIGIHAGYGIDNSLHFSPYIGVGITYNLFSF